MDEGTKAVPSAAPEAEASPDLSRLRLDVYAGRDGWWNPEHGLVALPDDWDFLPTGNAFVTRTVKAAGAFWLAWAPRSRSQQHRRLQGLWAPTPVIENAWRLEGETAAARAVRREAGSRSRAVREERYERGLAEAIVGYLRFAPEHAALAETIARAAAQRAAVVGSGRVGRTRVLALDARAELAARAQIRHQHTDYDVRLDELWLLGEADVFYRDVKAEAQELVDEFIRRHR